MLGVLKAGGCVRTLGSLFSTEPPCVHDRGQRDAGAAYASKSRTEITSPAGRCRLPGFRLGGDCNAGPSFCGTTSGESGRSRLCPLHFWFDRQAQRSGDTALRSREFPAFDAERTGFHRSGHPAGCDDLIFRHCWTRDLLASCQWRSSGHRQQRRVT